MRELLRRRFFCGGFLRAIVIFVHGFLKPLIADPVSPPSVRNFLVPNTKIISAATTSSLVILISPIANLLLYTSCEYAIIHPFIRPIVIHLCVGCVFRPIASPPGVSAEMSILTCTANYWDKQYGYLTRGHNSNL